MKKNIAILTIISMFFVGCSSGDSATNNNTKVDDNITLTINKAVDFNESYKLVKTSTVQALATIELDSTMTNALVTLKSGTATLTKDNK